MARRRCLFESPLMNPTEAELYLAGTHQLPKNAEALSFWERGRQLLSEAEEYRHTDWKKFSDMVWKGIRLKSAADSLDDALSLRG